MSSPEGEEGNEQNEQQEIGQDEPHSNQNNIQEQQEEVFEDDQPQGSAPAIQEVSGGHHGKTYLGGQYGQYIGTQVNKTYNPVAASTKPQEPGEFQVSCYITVSEKDPISLPSRIFKGSLHSDVTGVRAAAIKITAAQKQNYREARIYFSVPHHKNIVERFATDTFSYRGQPSIFIAMQHCDCDLYHHVKSEVEGGVEFVLEKYTWIANQILVGLNFLHSLNVVHGDLKPANVLLILNGNIVKLTDFGLSRAITQGNTSTELSAPQGGTTGWLAPEVLERAKRISKATDIFPCGLTLYYVWSHGKHAYGDRTVSLNHYIVEGINLDLSRMLVPFADDAKVLLEKMLQRGPADRPSVQEILQSEIFNRSGSQPTRVDDVKVAEVFDQALRFMNSEETEAANLSEDPLPISARQVRTAMRTLVERNQMRLISGEQSMNLSLPVEELSLASSSSESSLHPQSVDTEVSPSMDAPASRAFEGRSEATNPKELFAGSEESTSDDNLVTTSHQSRNIESHRNGSAEASGSSQTSSASTSLSLPVEEPRSSESSPSPQSVDTEAQTMIAPAFRAFEGQTEATNPKQLFPSSQKLTKHDPLTTSPTIDSYRSEASDKGGDNVSCHVKDDTQGSSQTSSDSASLCLPVEEPRSSSRSSESSPLPPSVDTDITPSIDASASLVVEGQPEATNPEQLFVGSPKSTIDEPVTTSHQSSNARSDRSESAEASASEAPSRPDVCSQPVCKVTLPKQPPPSTQQPPHRSASSNKGSVSGASRQTATPGLSEATKSKQLFAGSQKLTSGDDPVMTAPQSKHSTTGEPLKELKKGKKKRKKSRSIGSCRSESAEASASDSPSRHDVSGQQGCKVTSSKQSPPSTQQPRQRSASENKASVAGNSGQTATPASRVFEKQSEVTNSEKLLIGSRISISDNSVATSHQSRNTVPDRSGSADASVSEVPQTDEAPSRQARDVPSPTQSTSANEGPVVGTSRPTSTHILRKGSCQTSSASTSLNRPVKEPRSSSGSSSLLPQSADIEVARSTDAPGSSQTSPDLTSLSLPVEELISPSRSSEASLPLQSVDRRVAPSMTDTPGQSGAIDPKEFVAGSQKLTSDDPVAASHQSRHRTIKGPSKERLRREKSKRKRTRRSESDEASATEVAQRHGVSSQQGRKVPSTRRSASANKGSVAGTSTSTEGSPLCRRSCDVILISCKPSDEQHLSQLASKIHGRNPCNGRSEFIHCVRYSIPEIILEQLSNVPDCDEGITTIIIAYLDATRPLSQALEEKNLKTFLLSKGLSGEYLIQKIQNMRRNLAVFAFRPTTYIGLDSAKIAVNICKSEVEESDGKLKSVTLENGKVVNNITFQGPRFPDVGEIINDEEVMTFIRMNLRRLGNPQYCNKH